MDAALQDAGSGDWASHDGRHHHGLAVAQGAGVAPTVVFASPAEPVGAGAVLGAEPGAVGPLLSDGTLDDGPLVTLGPDVEVVDGDVEVDDGVGVGVEGVDPRSWEIVVPE